MLTDLRWQNFADAWQRSDFGSHLILSLVLAGTVTVVTVLIAPLAAYAIAVLKIPGHRALFALFLVGIMIPLEGIIVPLYFTMRATPFASTIGSLIIAQVGLSVGFGVFWMRAAFLAIPPSLLESASLDGAGRFRLYRSIVLPLATPATITLALLTCMWVWNDYFLAFVLVNNPDQLPVTVALGDFTNKYATQVNLMSACAVLVALADRDPLPLLPASIHCGCPVRRLERVTPMMAWLMLACAIAFEVLATTFISSTNGFSRLWPTVGVLSAYAVSFFALSQAVKKLEIGVVYAIWSGVGTAIIATIGVIFFGDSINPVKVLALVLIIVGVAMLNLSTVHP